MKALNTTLILPLLATVALAETEVAGQQAGTQENIAPKQEILDPTLASTQQAMAQDSANVPADGEASAISLNNLPENENNAIGVLVDVNVGTLGVGLSVGYEFNEYFKARVRAGFLSYEHDDTWSDVDVTGEFCGNNMGVMFDYHPFGGRFHLTAGLNISDLGIDVEGSMDRRHYAQHIGKTYDFGGYQFIIKDEDVTARAEYKWNKVQPYLGLGWSSDGERDSELYFTFDMGVLFVGSGKLSVSHTGGADVITPDGNRTNISNDILESAMRKEGEDFFEIADDICVYPVIQLGVGGRF